MEQTKLTTKILDLMSSEINNWVANKDSITNGYDYETQLLEVARKVNLILIEQSIGTLPKSRNNKKNFTPYLVR
jgi:hypothetical protein